MFKPAAMILGAALLAAISLAASRGDASGACIPASVIAAQADCSAAAASPTVPVADVLDAGATSIEVDPLVITGHLGAGASLFVAGLALLAFAAPLGLALLTVSRNRRMAAAADASFQPDKPYAPGPIVLHGRVEKSEGGRHAVRVEVTQEGSESENSGVWSHTWTETSRRVFVEPFYVVDAAGRRTRVEPRDDVLLVDTMNHKAPGKRTLRICSAELTPGEEVWASGELTSAPDPEGTTGGYRGGAGLVLRAPPGQRMLLSSEPLAARFEAKAPFHTRWSLFLGFMAVLSFSLCFGETRFVDLHSPCSEPR